MYIPIMRRNHACMMFLVLINLMLPSNLWGEDSLGIFTWKFWSAYTQGEVREIVYRNSTSPELLSVLFWPVMPSLGLGGSLKVKPVSWLDADLQVESFFPLGLGTMVDLDFDLNYPFTHTDIRSETIVQMYGHFRLEAIIASPWDLGDWEIRPFGGISFRRTSWEAWGPAVQVATNRDNPTQTAQTNINGLAILYRIQQIILLVGLETSVQLPDFSLSAAVALGINPLYEDQDIHYLTGTTYKDYPLGGLWLRPSLTFRLPLGSGTLGVMVEYEVARGARGDVYSIGKNSSSIFKYTGSSGMEEDMFTCRLSWSHP